MPEHRSHRARLASPPWTEADLQSWSATAPVASMRSTCPMVLGSLAGRLIWVPQSIPRHQRVRTDQEPTRSSSVPGMQRIPQSVAMSACPTRVRCSGRALPQIPTETLAYRPRSPWVPSRDHQLWSLPRSGRTRMPWMLRAGRCSRAGRSIRRTAGSRPRHWPTSTGTARPRSSKAGTRPPATPWGSSTPTEATSGFSDRAATCCATTTRTRQSTHRRPWAPFSGAVLLARSI